MFQCICDKIHILTPRLSLSVSFPLSFSFCSHSIQSRYRPRSRRIPRLAPFSLNSRATPPPRLVSRVRKRTLHFFRHACHSWSSSSFLPALRTIFPEMPLALPCGSFSSFPCSSLFRLRVVVVFFLFRLTSLHDLSFPCIFFYFLFVSFSPSRSVFLFPNCLRDEISVHQQGTHISDASEVGDDECRELNRGHHDSFSDLHT